MRPPEIKTSSKVTQCDLVHIFWWISKICTRPPWNLMSGLSRLWQTLQLIQTRQCCCVTHWCVLFRIPAPIAHHFPHLTQWEHHHDWLLRICNRFTHEHDYNNGKYILVNIPSLIKSAGTQDVRVFIKVWWSQSSQRLIM